MQKIFIMFLSYISGSKLAILYVKINKHSPPLPSPELIWLFNPNCDPIKADTEKLALRGSTI